MKKLLSLMAAAAMAFSMLSPFAVTAYAEDIAPTEQVSADKIATADTAVSDKATETEDGADEPQTVIEDVAALFAALPKASDAESMDKEAAQTCFEQVIAAMDAFEDELDEADAARFQEKYGDLYENAEELGGVLDGILNNPEDPDYNPDKDIAVTSIQPMKETTGVYVTLTGRSKEELQNFSVDEFLSLMTTYDNKPIEVEDGYTQAEFYFEYNEEDIVNVPLNQGATIDLWYNTENYEDEDQIDISYSVRVVLGNGKQLDADNSHRYRVCVELCTSQTIQTYLRPNIYYDNYNWGTRWWDQVKIDVVKDSDVFDEIGIPGVIVDCWNENYETNGKYGLRLSIPDELARNGVTVKAYPMSEYLTYRDDGSSMSNEVSGLLSEDEAYTGDMSANITLDNYATAENLWCLVYYNENGRVLGYFGIGTVIHSVSSLDEDEQTAVVTLWSYDECGYQITLDDRSVVIHPREDYIDYYVNLAATDENGISKPSYGDGTNSFYGYGFNLPDGYSANQDYYITISSTGAKNNFTVTDGNGNNVTDDIVVCEPLFETAPFGYKINFNSSDSKTFVLTYGDTSNQANKSFYLYATENSKEENTYFRVNYVYAKNGEAVKTVESYVPSINNMTIDTYYRYDSQYEVGGYQVLLINEEMTADQLKTLVPSFSLGEGAVAQSGSVVAESGKTSLENFVWQDLDGDGADDTVIYNVHIPGDKVQNYMVTFVAKSDAAKLFVPGPDERYVVLNEDSNDRHDVMIANVGTEDLTGLTVTLEDAQNVKLDSYWTVGEDGNNTLHGFSSIDTVYEGENGIKYQYNQYSTLANIAKIRLLKDGDGNVSGTLVIKSANGGERRIKLTGVAGKPKLQEADLDPAVKYVHYSYILSTNNMYKNNTVTFAVTDGALPKGVSLYEKTGEIYGVPQEAGDFTFTVEATNSLKGFGSSSATYTLHVEDNTNANVYLSSDADEGYSIQIPLGVEQGAGTYDFLVSDPDSDQLFVSNGVIGEFQQKTSINGQDLQTISDQIGLSGTDITYVSGSTRLTISGQAFRKMISAGIIYTDQPNTISMEFREGGIETNEMKRTAQNFRVDEPKTKNQDTTTDSATSQSSTQSSGAQSGTTQSGTAQSGTAQNTESSDKRYVKALTVLVVDANETPQPGLTVQLHSTPRTGATGKNGSVTFYNVEFGEHTLTVKDANGNVLGTKKFALSSGAAAVVDNAIIAPQDSSMTVKVRIGDGSLHFVPSGDVSVPRTADDFNLKLYVTMLFISGAVLTAAGLHRKKEKMKQ